MEVRKAICPECGSNNTHDWIRKTKLGFEAIKKEYPNADTKDYVCLAHVCDDCNKHFYTKAEVNIVYIGADIPVSEREWNHDL